MPAPRMIDEPLAEFAVAQDQSVTVDATQLGGDNVIPQCSRADQQHGMTRAGELGEATANMSQLLDEGGVAMRDRSGGSGGQDFGTDRDGTRQKVCDCARARTSGPKQIRALQSRESDKHRLIQRLVGAHRACEWTKSQMPVELQLPHRARDERQVALLVLEVPADHPYEPGEYRRVSIGGCNRE